MVKLPDDPIKARQAALPPGSFEEMWNAVQRACIRFFPFDHEHATTKGALAYVVASAMSEAQMRLDLAETGIALAGEKDSGVEKDSSSLWTYAGEAMTSKTIIHTIYYTMVEVGLIEVPAPKSEPTSDTASPDQA